ncbi:MAG: glycoside hydrolase family 11 protein [Treponema sp.]|nr:glycoside hydrolase family 11 protein [Treponema sp.]
MKKELKKFAIILLSFALVTGFALTSCDSDLEMGDLGQLNEDSGFGVTQNVTTTSNRTGTTNGWDWEYWQSDRGVSNGTMTVNTNGTFSASWNASSGTRGNFLARVGKRFNNQSHTQVGQITITYTANNFNPGNRNNYLSVYGWVMGSPLIEYYIVESWGDFRPPGGSAAGTFNGYDLYRTTVNGPHVQGSGNFTQYWAVRQSKRTSGTIDVTAIFNEWNRRWGGMNSNLREVMLKLEGWEAPSNGTYNVTAYTLRYGNTTLGGSGTTTTPPANNNPPSNNNPPANPPASGSDTRLTFSNMNFQSNQGVSSYSVSNGSLNVNYGGQFREVRYNLQNAVNLANCSAIVVNGASANGQTAIKFYNSSGTELFVMWNNRSSSATDWTKTLSSAERNNTVARIGIMSQDTGSYSATINSVTFRGAGSSSGGGNTTPPSNNNPPPNNNSGSTFTFSQMSFQSNQGVSSYSVSNGALNVNYGGQFREVRYNLPSGVNLSSINQIVVNGTSANGQTAIKFYNSSGTEVFVMWNNRSSSATNWTKTLSSSEKNNTITRIGIMSQDTGSYSATINSVSFR